jgi:hypothetical protein
MRIVRVLRANLRALCSIFVGIGLLALASGCGSGDSSAEVQAAASSGGERGEAEKQARLKAYGTTGMPKTEKAKTTRKH